MQAGNLENFVIIQNTIGEPIWINMRCIESIRSETSRVDGVKRVDCYRLRMVSGDVHYIPSDQYNNLIDQVALHDCNIG